MMEDLQGYYPYALNADQKKALEALVSFFEDENFRVFILRGHAGTGKTSLVLGLMQYLTACKRRVRLLASTGRAAKVLQAKSKSQACTVHALIYSLSHKLIDEDKQKYRICFRVATNFDADDTVYFVDESSMLSDHKTDNHLEFGSGRLLTDFFTFTGKRKVVFIGDPCQLPPVNTPDSPTLIISEMKARFGIDALSHELTLVERFERSSGIWLNFDRLRKIIGSRQYPALHIETSCPDIHTYSDQSRMAEEYTEKIRQAQYHKAVLITHSNKAANTFNRHIRGLLFNTYDNVLAGESLLVVQNNYQLGLSNGDQITVKSVANTPTRRAGLSFRRLTLLYGPPAFQVEMKCLMIEDLLFSDEASLSQEQYIRLMIDFNSRMREKGIRIDSREYVDQIVSDPFVNALRVKFGYAMTCHKAQGGEWDDVFVLFEGSLNYMDPRTLHRWAYTAVTRAIKGLHVLRNHYTS